MNEKISLSTTLNGTLVKNRVIEYINENDRVAVSEKSEISKTDSMLAVTNDKNNFIVSSMDMTV